MPRIKRGLEEAEKPLHADLLAELAQELRAAKEFGQPRIEETEFPTKAIRVTALWDKWDRVPGPERSEVILRAYEQVEGKQYRDRIALAIGLTFPEAQEIGLLLYRLEPAVRPGDSVSLEQCYQAMRAQGASELFEPGKPELWFATRRDAEVCRDRLKKQVPGSDANWLITKEFGPREQ